LEDFALEQLCSVSGLEADEIFFWRTHGGAGMDLIVERVGKRYGFEFKVTEDPGVGHA
jgi:predicted AAA+ superfamily ATPase